jgi:hypothetical protein
MKFLKGIFQVFRGCEKYQKFQAYQKIQAYQEKGEPMARQSLREVFQFVV